MVPGIAAEKDRLACSNSVNFACLWIDDHHQPLKNMQNLVCGKDGAKLIRVSKSPPGWYPKDKLMNLSRLDINPIGNFTRNLITP